MADNEPTVEVTEFLGLRNTDRPATLPLGSLVEATNIDIDDKFRIERRSGYSPVAGLTAVTAAYSTRDEKNLYVVDGGILKRVVTLIPLVTEALATGITDDEVWWDDEGGYVFCSGAINGVIHAGVFVPYEDFGTDIEQAVDVQGRSLATDEADVGTTGPPANTECVTYFEGSVWLAYYHPNDDQTFIFKSKPFFWSRWDMATDYIAVPGRIAFMAAHTSGVIIGTDQEVWAFSQGQLTSVAEYGAIPCQAQEHNKALYFWTERGLCRGLPFEALTEEAVSVPPGTRAAMVISRERGRNTALVVTTGGGAADNAYA